jgi:hypothetical protein
LIYDYLEQATISMRVFWYQEMLNYDRGLTDSQMKRNPKVVKENKCNRMMRISQREGEYDGRVL